jgi:hypothetical protein
VDTGTGDPGRERILMDDKYTLIIIKTDGEFNYMHNVTNHYAKDGVLYIEFNDDRKPDIIPLSAFLHAFQEEK